MKKILCLCLVCLCFCFVGCGGGDTADPWESAVYTEDTSLGSGSKTVTLAVVAGEKTVTFTINTDKEILGEALLENGIIAGENGPYGLYVKSVNGIVADYDINQSYWAFTQSGEYMQTGVDGVKIQGGEVFEATYTLNRGRR